MKYTDRLTKAFAWANEAHAEQKRKGSHVPYICHPMGVASIVIEAGGSEDAAIAALLHDVLEDQPDYTRPVDIRLVFGEHVRYLVEELTENKIDWKAHPKEEHDKILRASRLEKLEHLRTAHADVRTVKAADSLYNVRSILDQYRSHGERTFRSFRGGADEVIQKYTEMGNLFWNTGPNQIARQISDTLTLLAAERVKTLIRAPFTETK